MCANGAEPAGDLFWLLFQLSQRNDGARKAEVLKRRGMHVGGKLTIVDDVEHEPRDRAVERQQAVTQRNGPVPREGAGLKQSPQLLRTGDMTMRQLAERLVGAEQVGRDRRGDRETVLRVDHVKPCGERVVVAKHSPTRLGSLEDVNAL
jgi:hypothetical protein